MLTRPVILLAALFLAAAAPAAEATFAEVSRSGVVLPQDETRNVREVPNEPTKGIGAMFIGMAFLLRRKRR